MSGMAVALLAFDAAQAAGSGPASGGNTLTITSARLGNGSDITNVTVCGVPAAIQSQRATEVTVILGACDGGTGNINVYSASRGVTTFTNAYTYNPPGAIFGSFLGVLYVSNLPVANYSMGTASANGKLYAIGGVNATPPYYYIPAYLSTVYAYDPAQPSLGWSPVNFLPMPRGDLAGASVNGKLYAIGGYDGSHAQATVYAYDPSQSNQGWLSVSNLPAARRGPAAVSVDGKIYAIGGTDGTNIQATVYVYDPSQPSLGWLSVSNLPAAIDYLAAASINGKVYAIGGNGNGGWQSTVYVYDPTQPSLGWLSASNLPAALEGPAAESVNGTIYVMGAGQPYVYNPLQPALGWLNASNLPEYEYMGAESVNGQIYALGGSGQLYPYFFSTAYEGSFATGVVPASGSLPGGNTVTISGNNLGNGDVTSVTLCGVSATIVTDNSPIQVVVSAGASAIAANGNVMVNSTSYGATIQSNAFTYLPPAPNSFAATNVTLNSFYANWSRVTGAANYLLDVSTTNNFASYVAGYSNLTVGTETTLWVNGLDAGTTYYYRVRCQENGFTSTSSSTIAQQILTGGAGASSGPAAGGNTLTISGTGLGNGSDITNVTIGGVVAAIQSQTANSVTVVVGTGGLGTGNITVGSTSRGVTTFVNGYTYNPPGAITGAFTGWLSVSNLPEALVGLAAASVNGKVYAIGGSDGAPQSTVYVYDPAQPTQGWLSVSNLPGGRESSGVVSVNGKIYVIGGYDGGNILSTANVYDPSQPTQGWLSVSNLPATREYLGAASANGKIYAMGGYYSYDTSSAVYVYDPAQPTEGWLSVSNLPVALEFLASASVNGEIYAIGGGIGGGGSSVYVYDPSQPTLGWLSVSNLPTPLFSLASATANGKIYAIGGTETGVSMQSTVYVYDPSQPSLGWLSVANLPSALAYLAATSVNGTIYVLGGYDGSSYYSTAYEGTDIPAVAPSSGPLTGGNTVIISGNNLGNGDVTGVTLCGIPATILADNSPTQVVVSAGVAAGVGTGNVVVNSATYGVTVKSNAYSYLSFLTIMAAYDGTHLQLSWPTNYLGSELQVQTNFPGTGLGANWYPVAASTTTNRVIILIDPANPSVFYRLNQE